MAKRFIILSIAVLFIPVFIRAGSTKIASTWRNPKAGQLNLAKKKMAAFLISPDASMRQGPEETLATEIRKRGVDCLAGYTVMPSELAKDLDKAKEFIKKIGITEAIVMQVVGNEQRTSYTAEMMGSLTYYQGFWSYWNYGWTTAYSTGYLVTDKVVSIDILFYSVEHDTLLWAGKSETTNPNNVRKFAKDLVDAVAKELKKNGLLPK
jgi:hypothetical protein